MSRCDYKTWAEFQEQVLGLLPLDKSRLIQGDLIVDTKSAFMTGLMRQAIIDLQNYIPNNRKGHETVYYPQDFTTEGLASKGTLPPQAALQDAWLFRLQTDRRTKRLWDDDPGVDEPLVYHPNEQLIREVKPQPPTGPARYPLKEFGWEKRFELVNGMVALNDNQGRICVDPYCHQFYVYPEVTEGFLMSLFWDGTKLDYKDDELVPFTEQTAGAVAAFVRGMIARDIDKDMAAYASYFGNGGTYVTRRRDLYLAALDQGRMAT